MTSLCCSDSQLKITQTKHVVIVRAIIEEIDPSVQEEKLCNPRIQLFLKNKHLFMTNVFLEKVTRREKKSQEKTGSCINCVLSVMIDDVISAEFVYFLLYLFTSCYICLLPVVFVYFLLPLVAHILFRK